MVDGHATIRIRDSGIGIAPELQHQIFEPFVRGRTLVERTHGGLGIGLALANELVRMHGGRISVHSQGPGTGSEFAVHLPLPDALAEEPSETPLSHATLTDLCVLVVDDNTDAADVLAEYLEALGCAVSVAYNGNEALDVVTRQVPDIVLLDIGLPDLDGFEVGRRMRADLRLERTPIVALTGYGQKADRKRSEAAGFAGHLVKPVDLTSLENLLAEVPRLRAVHSE